VSNMRAFFFWTVVTSCLFLFGQEQPKTPRRDPVLLDVLARVVNAAGGPQTLASVHDLTESGEITFCWGDGVKGPVTIRTLGRNNFRMEANLPDAKKTWVVRNGSGTRIEGEKTVPMTNDGALNLENITYPLAHVTAALTDSATDVSLVGIEKQEGRSLYRLRVKGQLGLASESSQRNAVTKELLIDALNFDIVSVEDRPFPNRAGGSKDTPSRTIEYGDFRVVKGARIPFSITTKLLGQKTFSIHLADVTFNSNLTDEDFQK
jgi:hypothetical protein